jgi:polyphosphate kinase
MRQNRLTNREMSWLDFNERVLTLAEDEQVLLFERVKFLAIASRNLDEFFQVRVALLNAEFDSQAEILSPDGLTAGEQLDAIREHVLRLVEREERVWGEALRPALAERGVRVAPWSELDEPERKELNQTFYENIFPVLTPLAVDPAHPFPYISNLSFNLAVMIRDEVSGSPQFARVKIPRLFDRFQRLRDAPTFVPIEEIIAAHLDELFPGKEILFRCPFRVTRDADLDLHEGDADDLLVALQSSLERRRRRSDAVRLEVAAAMTEDARQVLLSELQLGSDELYVRDGMLDLGDLLQLYDDFDGPDGKQVTWTPQIPGPFAALDGELDVFSVLRERDVLLHHPYESFDQSVLKFLEQAAADPEVLAIKQTLYRSSGPENPIGRTLIRAANAGKQVVTVVELKARFDEETNIEWARTLEQAGIHVLYGIVGLKTHAKAILVIRREGDAIRHYCHIGTGNYNPATARDYEDIGLFSARRDLGQDLVRLFNALTGSSRPDLSRDLVCAPEGLRAALVRWIGEEIEAGDGEIVLKVNSLADPQVIDALYEASQAGVAIDLIVRGICCLRPGVPGLSESIGVRSVLGRYLEHSRVYRFGSKRRGRRYYIGSADLMPRNLDRRVEAMAPIEAVELQQRLDEIIDALLCDDELAWTLEGDEWLRRDGGVGFGAQEMLQERAVARSKS